MNGAEVNAGLPAGTLPGALGNIAKGLAQVPGRKTVVLFSEGASVSVDQMEGAIAECNHANVAIYPVDIRALTGKREATQVTSPSALDQATGIRRLGTKLWPGKLLWPHGHPLRICFSGLAKGTGGFVVSRSGTLPDDLKDR